jgi:NAD(P)-dependent dehydrogenase (short-subunit alcohol dehydrogenase family)
MKKLENQTAIITGASSGMGRAMALLFAAEGANVVVADLRQESIDEVVALIKSAGGNAVGVTCDVSSEAAIQQLIRTTTDKYPSLDILVNNAGIMDDFTPVESVSDDLWNRVMAVNVNGPFYACRLAVPLMVKQGKGVILNIASVGGLFGSRAGLAYTTSKHALIGMTKNIGYMYAKKGIRCNAIAPGGVNTNIVKDMHPDPFGMERCMTDGAKITRMGESEEIAKTALFLVSDDSSFISGSVITADGGWTAY